MNKRLPQLLALSLGLACASVLSAATTIVRGPYLQSATPTSMVVRWRTDIAEASAVSYGVARNELTENSKAFGVSTEHIVQLSNLKPGTRYFYSVGPVPFGDAAGGKKGGKEGAVAEDAPGRAQVYSFTTPPEAGPAKAMRAWFLGDAGTKNDIQRAVRDQYYKFTGARGTDLVILLGDNAYPDGTDSDYQKGIFEMYPETLRTVPVWSCLGNHDGKSANSITQSGVYIATMNHHNRFNIPTSPF